MPSSPRKPPPSPCCPAPPTPAHGLPPAAAKYTSLCNRVAAELRTSGGDAAGLLAGGLLGGGYSVGVGFPCLLLGGAGGAWYASVLRVIVVVWIVAGSATA